MGHASSQVDSHQRASGHREPAGQVISMEQVDEVDGTAAEGAHTDRSTADPPAEDGIHSDAEGEAVEVREARVPNPLSLHHHAIEVRSKSQIELNPQREAEA